MADYIKNHPEVDKNQDGKIQYILLEGEAGHQDAISRTDYSVKTLLEQEINLEKLSYQFADWNRGQAENRMSRLIEQYGEKIELVISNNDEMALGAVAACQKAGYDCQTGLSYLELTVWMMRWRQSRQEKCREPSIMIKRIRQWNWRNYR